MWYLVTVHGSPLRVAAKFAVSRGTDRPAGSAVAACCAALLQSQKLLGTEGFIVDLAGGFDQVLQMGAGQEVSQVDELAVVLVFDVNDTPAVLSTADLLATDNDVLLATDDSERNDVLCAQTLVQVLPGEPLQ